MMKCVESTVVGKWKDNRWGTGGGSPIYGVYSEEEDGDDDYIPLNIMDMEAPFLNFSSYSPVLFVEC